MDMILRSRSNILKFCLLACNANFSFIFNNGLTTFYTMMAYVCRLHKRFQFTFMILESKVKVTFTYIP